MTGAAGGLGRAAVTRFIAEGWRVAAADLVAPTVDGPDGPDTPDTLLSLAMDVRDTASVAEAMRQVEEWAPDGLGALITFAAVGGVGPLMETPVDGLATVMDVNVVGTHRTVLAAWRHVRRGGGRVILIGSETGRQHAWPLKGPYAMSKHAIEAYADALRRELMFVGVPVVLMQPGPFRTSMVERVPAVFDALPEDSPFKALAQSAVGLAADTFEKASDPSVLAEAVVRAASVSRPRDRYPVAVDRGRALLDRLPVGVVDRMLRVFPARAVSRAGAEVDQPPSGEPGPRSS